MTSPTIDHQHLRPGKPYPLGATWDGHGVNFALFSEHATAVELCLFDANHPEREHQRVRLREQTGHVWHSYLPGIAPGQLYGYRVYGPSAPEHGQRFNPAKLLLDPYAKAISGPIIPHDATYAYRLGTSRADLEPNTIDSAAVMPKAVVIDEHFDWEGDRHPQTSLHRSVIYEMHVKGFTQQHPEIPAHLRGTYAGLASEPAIKYLKELGVTAVELLPVHQHAPERRLIEQGLTNYWGYNTLGFFAPDERYSSAGTHGEQVREFKEMVKALHRHGIEVILDVVYNHTAEGNHLGPTLSFKGIDNQAYYRQVPHAPRFYVDYSGCGNTLNVRHPQVLQLIMDSLRYWILDMHVDGFRFDLAPALARDLHEVDRLSAFFDIIHQDPVISQVKLIAEPWDVGEGGYQVGNFPVLWAEWNGKYRDQVRSFWRGNAVGVGELAFRLTGSSDLYQHNGRRPYASINFVTSHDGFTLNDLVTYNNKHNLANGEGNRDGDNHNLSWNCGTEGPTNDPRIVKLREQQKRNILATLLLSQGVPMLCGGDERGRTQRGNNNAYCQDNELSWLDWNVGGRDEQLLRFTQRLIRLRREHPVLHRRTFFQGRAIRGSDVRDIVWYEAGGAEMTNEQWNNGQLKTLGMLLNGLAIDEVDEWGDHVVDDMLLLLINGQAEPVRFKLPGSKNGPAWRVMVDTSLEQLEPTATARPGTFWDLAARSVVLLCQPHEAL